MKRKLISILLVMTLTSTLFGCGKKAADTNTKSNNQETTAEVTSSDVETIGSCESLPDEWKTIDCSKAEGIKVDVPLCREEYKELYKNFLDESSDEVGWDSSQISAESEAELGDISTLKKSIEVLGQPEYAICWQMVEGFDGYIIYTFYEIDDGAYLMFMWENKSSGYKKDAEFDHSLTVFCNKQHIEDEKQYKEDSTSSTMMWKK